MTRASAPASAAVAPTTLDRGAVLPTPAAAVQTVAVHSSAAARRNKEWSPSARQQFAAQSDREPSQLVGTAGCVAVACGDTEAAEPAVSACASAPQSAAAVVAQMSWAARSVLKPWPGYVTPAAGWLSSAPSRLSGLRPAVRVRRDRATSTAAVAPVGRRCRRGR